MSHASKSTEMCMLSQKPVLAVSGTKVLNLILNLRTSLKHRNFQKRYIWFVFSFQSVGLPIHSMILSRAKKICKFVSSWKNILKISAGRWFWHEIHILWTLHTPAFRFFGGFHLIPQLINNQTLSVNNIMWLDDKSAHKHLAPRQTSI